MTMVALDAPREKVVETGSIEARWLVNEGDASTYIREAKKQPKMQALMKSQAKDRLADERKAAEQAALEAAARKSRLQAIGFA